MPEATPSGSAATLLKIPQGEWRTFFDRMSKGLLGKRAEIEALDRANRLIRRPGEIDVEEGMDGLNSVAILDADGVRHIIRMKVPLMLPPATMT